MPAPSSFRPGFVVLHGNRLEDLADVALDWLARHPLGPLDEETLLVPSSGMAEWLKGAMATRHGVAAGFRIELPARFVWRVWRTVLGDAAVPTASPLDKAPLTWWLMRLLPRLATRTEFAPLAEFLAADDAVLRRLELARRLADLFDQYQVYRPDWLDDWAAGRDRLSRYGGDKAGSPLPEGQRWQPALWRALLAELDAGSVSGLQSRPALHRRFIDALNARPEGSPPPGLPQRLLLFGTTHLPHTTLEALGALSRHIPVLLAVPDPCRMAWADEPPDAELVHPLLQAWGRQCRDFVRQLQAYDEGRARAEQLGLLRTELFNEAPAGTVLQQLQERIRDLVPMGEGARALPPGDRSLQFHTAHGPMREVEVLHDQLLDALARGGLEARDVVVMVPDIERFAPAIHAVFGRFEPGHPRHIPWGLADRSERGRHALLRALDGLLQVRDRRWAFSELRDLLGTAAVAECLGLDEADVEQIAVWMAGAGARWGLHEAQRTALGLGAAGELGSWRFALDRLLMGYATGQLPIEAEPPGGIDPWPEPAGLVAALIGPLAEFLETLDTWWADAATARAPRDWLPRLRALLEAVFTASDDVERSLLALLDESLQAWVAACEAGGFDEAVELALVREAWLAGVDEGGSGRFRAGGVTFCTLLPLRAIPFRHVCLLGMNDGEYPRPTSRSDFDLMSDPVLARPGDRSRRDDDRQLMLDALLAARDCLSISWSAHAARDNQPQPPSVLVAQLRDHVRTLWGEKALDALTVAHPLQPFSRRYVEEGGDARLYTFAHEWRALHEPPVPPACRQRTGETATTAIPSVSLLGLAEFVRNPVRSFFIERLRADLRLRDDEVDDDEAFVEGGLEGWQWRDELLRHIVASSQHGGEPARVAASQTQVQGLVDRLLRTGRLPWGAPGRAAATTLRAELAPVLQEWCRLRASCTAPGDGRLDPIDLGAVSLDPGPLPWFESSSSAMLIDIVASRVTRGKLDAQEKKPHGDKLVTGWLQQLVMAASGKSAALSLVGIDAVVRAQPFEPEPARRQLVDLAQAWSDGTGIDGPWPTVLATGLALLEGDDRISTVYEGSHRVRGDVQDPHLARLYPSFDALRQQAQFEVKSRRLYAPFKAWLDALVIEPLADAVAGDDDSEDEGEGDD